MECEMSRDLRTSGVAGVWSQTIATSRVFGANDLFLSNVDVSLHMD
jgi:hypothetical protein